MCVNSDRTGEFLQAIHEYDRVRRRDGTVRWGVFRDLEETDRYVETFVVSSWAVHLRQHERMTKAVPTVRHLVSALSRR